MHVHCSQSGIWLSSKVNVFVLPVQLLPLILPSPVRPGGQRQTKPSIESIQVALYTQSASPLEQAAAHIEASD